jgi:glutamyl-tRNA synthetase
MHIGQLFTSLVNAHIASQSAGIFFLRIEDTDTKREVEGAAQFVIDNLRRFGIAINE